MTYTRKQVVSCISVVYLVVATGLAGYASSRANNRSVPISDTLTGFATALPLISGLLLECGYDFTRILERRKDMKRGETERPPLVIIANTFIFIYSTVIITLLGTHAAPPSGLNCGLHERWQNMYRVKKVEAIRTIQDAFSCCGLTNSRDMAWPFPDKTHDARACETSFNRNTGCLAAWKAEEQQVAGILMAVVGMVFLWQFTIIVVPTQKESWLHSVAPDRISRMIADERHDNSQSRSAVDYLGYNSRFSDRIEEADESLTNERTGRAIEEGNGNGGAFPGAVGRGQQTGVENEWTRN